MAAPPPDGRPPSDNEAAESAVSVDALANELRKVLRSGLDRLDPVDQRPLLGLGLVRRRARTADYPDNDDGLTLALRDVITDAVRALGDGPPSRAARLLFGTVPDSRGRALAERRRLAGDALDVVASTFRKNYEPRLVHEVAAEILRVEHAPDLQVINNPDPQSDPTGEPPAPLHIVIDPPDATTDTLYATPPTMAADRSTTPRSRPLEWLMLALVATWSLWWIMGLGVVLRAAVVALAVSFVATLVRAVREGRAYGAMSGALLDQLPRLVLLGAATVVAIGAIAAVATGTATSRPAPCSRIVIDASCSPSSHSPTTIPAELSPNYVPTTHVTAPATRAVAECPPAGNTRRRLSFTGVPPVCIHFDADYVATVATNFGTFQILLNTQRAPYTVNNFIYLARWRFFEGITLGPDPQPLTVATSMRTSDPVDPDDTDKVPGYGLTFDNNTYPDLPALDPARAWVVMTDTYHPNRWAVVITEAGRNEVELNPQRWPLVGQVACGLGVIANDAPDGDYPAHTSAPIVIDTITIRQLTNHTTPNLQPDQDCD